MATYDDGPGTYLFYCDREWNCLNDRCHEDLAAAEAQALFEFPGVASSPTHDCCIRLWLSDKAVREKAQHACEVHLRAAVHDALATDRLRATDEMAVFGTHPYKRSSGLAKGFPDSHA